MILLLSVLILASIKLALIPEASGDNGSPSNLVHPNMSDNFYVSTQSDNVPANQLIEGTNYTSFFLANLVDDTHLPLISPKITMDSQYAPSSFWSISPWPNSTEKIGSVYRYVWSKDILNEQSLNSAPNIGPSLYYEPYPSKGSLDFDSRRQISPPIISNQTGTAVAKVFVTPAENIERLCIIVHADETNEVSPLIVDSGVDPQPTPVSVGNFTSSNEVDYEFLNVLADQELELTIPMQVYNKEYPNQVMYEPHITIFSHQGVLAGPWNTVIGSNVTLVHPRWGNVTFSGEGEYAWTYPQKIPQEIRGVDYDLVSNVVAGASGTITISADGSITPPTAPIYTSDNITYTLTGNITSDGDGLQIERDNMILDGAGYMLGGASSTLTGPTGITLSGRSNVTIRNLEIRSFGLGIYIWQSSYCSVSQNNVVNCASGIWLDSIDPLEGGTYDDTVSGNNIVGTGYNNPTKDYLPPTPAAGLYLSSVFNNTIIGNNITESIEGICVSDSANNTFLQNIMENNQYNLLLENGPSGAPTSVREGVHNSIDSTNLADGKPVFCFENKTDLVINPTTYPQIGYLALVDCLNATVQNVTLTNNGDGLLLFNTNDSRILGNRIENSLTGLFLDSSCENTVKKRARAYDRLLADEG